MPCFLIKQRSSSTDVGSKEESWYVEEDAKGGVGVAELGSEGEGRVERMSETLDKKYLLKASARVEGSSCEGKERLFLLLSKSLLKVLKSFCWSVLLTSTKREE